MRPFRPNTRHILRRHSRAAGAFILALLLGGAVTLGLLAAQAPSRQTQPVRAREFLDKHCVTCHNQKIHTAGLALDGLDVTKPDANPEVWERVIAKLRAGTMPPPGNPRPDAAAYHA